MLARQPDGVRDFLLRTAVLDRLAGPLGDALTGRTDGARMLTDLERGNLFLVPLDDHRAWYRYHYLFADVLRARLLGDQPVLLTGLHQRASDWFAAHRPAADSIRHALAAGHAGRAGYLIEQEIPQLRRDRPDALPPCCRTGVNSGMAAALPGGRVSPVYRKFDTW